MQLVCDMRTIRPPSGVVFAFPEIVIPEVRGSVLKIWGRAGKSPWVYRRRRRSGWVPSRVRRWVAWVEDRYGIKDGGVAEIAEGIGFGRKL